ncbi:unnamed protein product [Camellia sinensis]
MINAGIFQNVVNVDVAGEAHYRAEDANVVTDVNCKGCRKLLGWKFEKAAESWCFRSRLKMFQEPGVCFYRCCQCSTTLAFTDHLVSKRQNVTAAGPFHYQIDGNNLVADVTCNGCNSLLGWKYSATEKLRSSAQKIPIAVEQASDVGWKEHAVCRYTDGYIRIWRFMFQGIHWLNYVNVDVAGKAHYRMQCTDTVADVNSSGCRKLLGWKYIEVPKEETIFLKTRTFLLHLNMLLKWNGTNMQCADYIWTG